MNEREKNLALKKLKFENLHTLLKQAVAAKAAHREIMASIDGMINTYASEFIDQKRRDENVRYKSVLQGLAEKIIVGLGELQKHISDSAAVLDLENPALSNALKIIEFAGNSLEFDQIQKINSNFEGDRASLAVIQKAYKAAGMLTDGGLDKLLYNIEATFENLRNGTIQALVQDDRGINHLISSFSKVAAREGVDLEPILDEIGFMETTRKAAGLVH